VIAGEQYGRAPREFLEQCLKDVQGFSSAKRQVDDQTLMVIQRADSTSYRLAD
jgi:serine phosphatase RsbU (regulator of sigma subunit)